MHGDRDGVVFEQRLLGLEQCLSIDEEYKELRQQPLSSLRVYLMSL